MMVIVIMKVFMMMIMMTVMMMMLMIRIKFSHRCFWWNIDCCARGGLFQAIPEDHNDDVDGDDGDGDDFVDHDVDDDDVLYHPGLQG